MLLTLSGSRPVYWGSDTPWVNPFAESEDAEEDEREELMARTATPLVISLSCCVLQQGFSTSADVVLHVCPQSERGPPRSSSRRV